MTIMATKNDYISPSIEAFCVEVTGGFCIGSGATHEGTTEEDWDEPLP